jgi:hypothetical protein
MSPKDLWDNIKFINNIHLLRVPEGLKKAIVSEMVFEEVMTETPQICKRYLHTNKLSKLQKG